MPGGRGGRRTGAPGATYPNRTDLNATRTLPIQAPTGLPYGEHQQLIQSQQAVPIATPASPPAPGVVPTPPPAAPPAPSPFPAPGALPLNRPSERLNEPVSSGAAMGPGPTTLGGGGGRISDLIASAAAASGDQDLAFLANQARSRGQ